MKKESFQKLVLTGVFAALSYVVFTFLQIKIPLPGGDATSIHLGNAVCVLGALILGGLWGGIGGSIGMTIGDLFDPVYVVYAPKTFILKLCIGLITGLIAHHFGHITYQTDKKKIARIAALAALGGLIFNTIFDPLVGYFYKLLILGKPAAELTLAWNITATAINTVISTIVSVLVYMALLPALKKSGLFFQMNLQIPKKAAVINSFAGYGRCSLTEALPILSAMRVQACPVPTAVFSNHTGFAAFACQDLTAFLPSYLEQWKQLNLTFDGVLCGFLGQAEQILSVSSFLSDQKSRGCQTILVDPVMGDHGKPYRTITPKHCQKLRSLIPLADIITPNITEACLLTDTPWKDGFWNESELSELCQRLHKLGPSKIVITGLPCLIHGKEGFENYLSCKEPFSQRACLTPSAGPSRHGTGDIFASILMADALNGVDFSVSVQKAADFISKCISASKALQIPEPDGVCFENFLSDLADQ